MFKHDTMTQYVTDRAPHLAPRPRRRVSWGAAAHASEMRQQAVASLSRPVAPVVEMATRRHIVPATMPVA